MKIFSTASVAFLVSMNLNAESPNHGNDNIRQLDVHGLAELTLAQEGNKLELNLRSPADNIVGFEHKASNNELVHSDEDARQNLMSGKRNFVFRVMSASPGWHRS